MLLRIIEYPTEIGFVGGEAKHTKIKSKLIAIKACCDTVERHNINKNISVVEDTGTVIIRNSNDGTLIHRSVLFCPYCGAKVEREKLEFAYIEIGSIKKVIEEGEYECDLDVHNIINGLLISERNI